MASYIGRKMQRRLLAGIAAGVILSATFAVVAFPVSASAEEHRGDRDRRDGWGEHHRGGWGGGYYREPPVVYGAPYYAPPPVVYGPGFGLNLNIR